MRPGQADRDLNVLHVVPSFFPAHSYGGPIQSVLALCRALSRHGCAVRVLTTNSNGLGRTLDVPTDREVELDGFTVRYCRKLARNSISANARGGSSAGTRTHKLPRRCICASASGCGLPSFFSPS